MSKTARPLAQSSAPESPGPLALSLFLKYSLHFLIFFLAPPVSLSPRRSLSLSPHGAWGWQGANARQSEGLSRTEGANTRRRQRREAAAKNRSRCGIGPLKKDFYPLLQTFFVVIYPRTRSPSASSFSAR